jgi:hypothetical protein
MVLSFSNYHLASISNAVQEFFMLQHIPVWSGFFNVSKKSSGSSVGLVLQKLPKLWLAEVPRETCWGSQGSGSLQNKFVISS